LVPNGRNLGETVQHCEFSVLFRDLGLEILNNAFELLNFLQKEAMEVILLSQRYSMHNMREQEQWDP
jgi:hypothetical protein